MDKFKSQNRNAGFRNSISPHDTLRKLVIKSGLWIFVLRVGERLLRMVKLVVLARLLSPNDFGLFGVALLTIELLMTFFRSGFVQALIQKKNDTELYLNTAWTIGIIRRSLLACVLFFSAPYAATFFNAPGATSVIRIISITFIFKAVTNIAVVFFEKELEFQKYFIYQFSGTLVEFTVSIGCAFLFRSYWALVIGFLSGILAQSIISYIISPYRPALHLELSKAKELFRYGKWILGSAILVYLGANLDNIFVGRLLGVAVLGLYQVAFKVSEMATSETSLVFSMVAFPAYSKIQDDPSRLQSAYLRVFKFNAAVSLFFVTGTICLAPEFTGIFLGEKWLSVIPIIQLLAAASFIRAIVSTASPLFKGTGHPNYDLYMHLAKVSLLVLSIYPLTVHWGISGAALSAILSTIGAAVIGYLLSKYTVRASRRHYIHALWPPFLSSLFMAGSIYLVKLFLDFTPEHTTAAIFKFIGIAITGAIVFTVSAGVIFKINPDYGIGTEIKLLYEYFITKKSKNGKID